MVLFFPSFFFLLNYVEQHMKIEKCEPNFKRDTHKNREFVKPMNGKEYGWFWSFLVLF